MSKGNRGPADGLRLEGDNMCAFQRLSAIALWVTSSVTILLTGPGCGQLVGNPHPPKDTGGGRSSIHVALTDAPIDDAKHLYVSFSRFALWHSTEVAWVDLNLSVEERVDILALREGITIPFGFHADIPLGRYERMLVQLDTSKPATLVYKNGEEIELAMVGDGSGRTEHDIFLDIEAGQTLHYTLDFDVRKSVIPKDAVELDLISAPSTVTVLAPHYRLVSDDEVGTVEGEGEPGDVICLYEIDSEKDTDELCLGSVNSGVVSADGKYKVPFMPAGSYGVRIFKSTGDYVDGDDEAVEVPVKDKTTTSASVKELRRPYVSHVSYAAPLEHGLSEPGSKRPKALGKKTKTQDGGQKVRASKEQAQQKNKARKTQSPGHVEKK